MIPNGLMIRFLTVAESGGTAGMNAEETAIAVAVGIEHGWMTGPRSLTDAGRAFTSQGTAKPEFVMGSMPPLMRAALDEIPAGKGSGFEDFEARHNIPARSAKVVLMLAREMQYAFKLCATVSGIPCKPEALPTPEPKESMMVAIEDYRLHKQSGMSIRAIARQRGVEPSTVQRRIRRVEAGMAALAT